MEEQKLGLNESMEFIDGLEIVMIELAQVLKDKHVDKSDLVHLYDAAKKYKEIIEAVKGVNLIIPEIKDIDAEEAKQLSARGIELAKNILVALKA